MSNKIISFLLAFALMNVSFTGLYNAYMDYRGYVNTFIVDDMQCVTNFTWFTSTTGCAIKVGGQ